MGSNRNSVSITGGSGFVGFSLARHLSHSFDVTLLDLRKPEERIEGTDFLRCDVRNCEEVKKSLKDVDLVIHTAIVQIPLINEDKRLGYETDFLGTQNVCRAVDENPNIKGMILAGSWHTMGERGLRGVINEEFGFRPDMVEKRARLYALAKIAQESIVRFYDEMSEKIYGIIRMGTVLGEGMPQETAANIFIENALSTKPLTPFKHSMYRPMLYVDIGDVCRAYEGLAKIILDGKAKKGSSSLTHIFNVYHPEPITIIELAKIVRNVIERISNGLMVPAIEVVDTGQPSLFSEEDKRKIKVDASKAVNLLHLGNLKSPEESIEAIVKRRIGKR